MKKILFFIITLYQLISASQIMIERCLDNQPLLYVVNSSSQSSNKSIRQKNNENIFEFQNLDSAEIILENKSNSFSLTEKINSNLPKTFIDDSIKTYTTDQIVIQGRNESFEKISSKLVHRISLVDQLTSTSIANLLASKPGIFTKSYGSEGSLQTISIRGSGSEYTSVLINGINFNSSLNGVFDFSKFSSAEISEIIVKKGNDFDVLNHNSYGGVIELNPFEKQDTIHSYINLQVGSFGYRGIQLKLSGYTLNSYYKLNFSRKSARNDYQYNFLNETGIRQNSDVNQNSINLALINQLRIFEEPIVLNSFVSFFDKNLGLPGFVSSNKHSNSGTREDERFFSYSLNSKFFISNDKYLNGIFGLNFNRLKIDDPLLSINLRTKIFELNEQSYQSKIFFNSKSGNLFFSTGFVWLLENFRKNEVNENQSQFGELLKRNTFSSSFKTDFEKPLINNFSLNSSILFSLNYVTNEINQDLKTYKFPNLRFGLSINYEPINTFLYANAGSGTRIPNYYEYSFSKLTSLNKSNLEPEKILNYELGLKTEQSKFQFELTYFTFDVENKIIWKPQRVAFFSPINSGRVKSSGLEISFERLNFFKSFYIDANYTFTNALKKNKLSQNDNSFNKQLPYVPKHKASITLSFYTKNLILSFNSNYYSRRFITEDNDLLFSLDPVLISNFSSTVTYKFKQLKFRVQLSLQNIFNQSYQLIQSFPMPGREYRLTIQTEV